MVAVAASRTPSRSEPANRTARLRLCLSQIRADAFLVSHLPNIRYLCGFSGSAGLLLVEAETSTLFTDGRYKFQAKEEVASATVHIAPKGLLRAVAQRLRGRRRYRVAYSLSHTTVGEKRMLDAVAGSRIRWVGDANAIEKLRCVKDPQELSEIRQAATLISDVFRRILPLVRPGIAELELAAEIEYAIKHGGGSGPSFETIVASGPRSAWPHARPTPKTLGKSELVVLDQGAIIRGYCSDMTRTVFVGRASSRVRRLFDAVLDAQQAAKFAIRPGVTAGEVDKAARRALRAAKLDRYFTHSTGHGLGLEVHEMPRLAKGDETVLREGMVLTVEPGVYLEGFGGVRIEDDVVVTASGCSDLTTAPRDFLEL